VELGIYTFAENSPDPATGVSISAEQRLRNLMEEVELADQVGLDVFGIGEHHRPDFVVSTPAVVLAAAAMRTKRIRLTSAVTVLSSDEPVRVFQEYATVDLLSGGRAEIMAGRGSFIESYPLFGYNLDDYDELFAEKLDLLLTVRKSTRVTWRGKHRAPIDNRGVYPRPVQIRCRCGSRWAARRSRWCAPARWAFRWRWRSSAARRSTSPISWSCIGRRDARPGIRRRFSN
jgi:alkanesulfonate monooxygenase SsuD/methylene tetrahydromethanopterin reductase-like flavin-dependent oxidoreductase (luciferase family)